MKLLSQEVWWNSITHVINSKPFVPPSKNYRRVLPLAKLGGKTDTHCNVFKHARHRPFFTKENWPRQVQNCTWREIDGHRLHRLIGNPILVRQSFKHHTLDRQPLAGHPFHKLGNGFPGSHLVDVAFGVSFDGFPITVDFDLNGFRVLVLEFFLILQQFLAPHRPGPTVKLVHQQKQRLACQRAPV